MNLLSFLKNLRLGIKLNLVALLGLTVLLTVIVRVAGNTTRRLILESGQRSVAQEAEVVQKRFDEAERALLANTKLLAGTPGLVEALTDRNADGVRTAILTGGATLNIDEVTVVDENGMLLVGTGARQTINTQEDALLRLALIGSQTTGAIIEEEGQPEFRIAAVVPLYNRSARLVGGLLANRLVNNAFLKEINLSRTDNIYLTLIHGGQIMAQDFPEQEESGDFAAHLLEPFTVGQALKGQTVIAEQLVLIDEDMPYALAHAPLTVGGDTDAVIAILANYRDLSTFRDDLARIMRYIFSIAGFIILAGIAWFSWEQITTPLGKLTSVTQKMTAGDYEQRAEVKAKDEIGQLSQAFNDMATELQQTLAGLEQRVADRTRAIETSTQVSRRLSTILDQEQLVSEVVQQVQEAFDYYHVHIYLLDEATQDMVMAGGTGVAGRAMLADGHRIAWGRGLIGQAATANSIVWVPNVRQDQNWLPNPLLPETRAEIAAPISIGERLLGVLDVQHNVTNGLSSDDVDVLTSIANQVAVALQNTRLFVEAQKRARYEERVNLISQRIQNTTTVEEALQVSIRELGRMLQTETSVYLSVATEPDDDQDKLAFQE